MGSLKSPGTTSYRSSIETIAQYCLVFEKIAFFCILATDRQTNKQTDEQMTSTNALSRSRYRERRLIKCLKYFFGYSKYSSATDMLFELGLPSFNPLIHNYNVSFGNRLSACSCSTCL